MSAETVVNAAKWFWEIIKDGAAAADIENSTANAVPEVGDWQALTDTRGPNSHRMHYFNRFMWPLDDYVHVEFEILLKWQYGSRYKNGGAFIPNVWIEVPQIFVGWPWNVNIGIHAQHPTNIGTAGAPVAALPVTVKGSVSSGAEFHHVEWGFVLEGTGASS